MKNKYLLLLILASLINAKSVAQTTTNDPLEEVNVFESLKKTDEVKEPPLMPSASNSSSTDINMSASEEQDDLLSLKDDIGEVVFEKDKKNEVKKVEETKSENISETKEENKQIVKDLFTENETTTSETVAESKKLELDEEALEDDRKILSEMAKNVKGKISNKEWKELVSKGNVQQYEVKPGDTLKSVAKTLFGVESLYAKIWSLNPQVTNPDKLEVGTILTFDSGDSDNPPKVQLGEFSEDEVISNKAGSTYTSSNDQNRPPWIKERKKLIDQGVYFQFASEETYEDLEKLERVSRNTEYEKYDPPINEAELKEPSQEYDDTGFDRSSKIIFNFKDGFYLNTFVTTNVIQDLGEVKSTAKEAVFIHKYDTIYVSFDKSAKVKPGDKFSVYTANGEVKHPISDRSGYAYTTTAQIKVIKKIDDVWECYVEDQSGIVQRKDRLTVFTPKIGKIAHTLSKRGIEAAIIGTFRDTVSGISYGDVVYIDRGRADGVELGNIFDVYSFVDRGTSKKISSSPTYKIGELTVINITDNFSTALVTGSKVEIPVGSIALTRTQEEAAKEAKIKNKDKLKDIKRLEGKALDELDVELNLDDVSQDILNKADKIQLTEDELEELERQERDKSIIKDSDKDVKELDRLESEIKSAESSLNEAKVDEDKFLEQSNLNDHEKKSKLPDPNAFESINELEKDIGRKYMDEDINNKENPYGLTEFDLEEVDELLNTGSKTKTK